jgi:hypothetical protein
VQHHDLRELETNWFCRSFDAGLDTIAKLRFHVEQFGGKDLLPDTSVLGLRGIQQDSDGWVVKAHAPAIAACPDCGERVTAVIGVS